MSGLIFIRDWEDVVFVIMVVDEEGWGDLSILYNCIEKARV